MIQLSSNWQRGLLFGFIGSICLCGLIGIYAIVFGSFGWLELRVMLSTAAVGAASVLALASAVVVERGRSTPIGVSGLIAASVALVLILVLVWANGIEPEPVARFAWGACVLSVACPHAGLLLLARLHRGYEFVRVSTLVCIAVLTGLLLWLCVSSDGSDLFMRAVAVSAILTVVGTIAVPILHRISGIRAADAVVTTTLQLAATCPRCAKQQTLPVGRSQCSCGLRFNIEIEEEHCRKCGYSLYRATSSVCPECGTPIA